MTLKAVKAHTWLYPHRSLFRKPITDLEAQAKEVVTHLSATTMGRSVSAHESHQTSYIPPSSSHLITHAGKGVSPPSSPELPSLTMDPRRHTVQVEYDKPVPTITREDMSKPERKIVLELPSGTKPTQKDGQEISALAVPPAPALARSATTGAAAPRPTVLDTVEERSPERTRTEYRHPSASSSVSGVAKPPTSRPAMPHGTKPRPTSYHPPSTGGTPMSKGRSASGDRTAATLLLQHRPSSGSSRNGLNEPSPTEPISSYQNVEGEIVQSNTPPQETLTAKATQPIIDQPVGPPPQRSKTHKRASASISMVADKVFGFFTKPSPPASPNRRPGGTGIQLIDQAKSKVARSNTTTRRNPFPGSATGSTVLARRREKSNNDSNPSITHSTTDTATAKSIPKTSRTPVKTANPNPPSQTFTSSESQSPVPKIVRSKTEGQPAVAPVVEVYSTGRRVTDNPKISTKSKKLGDLAPEKGSTGAARRVMEFFRRRTKGLMD